MAKQQKRSAESWRYILEGDRSLPVEEQTVFVLRPLTQAERADVHDNLSRVQHLPDGARTTVTRTHRLSLDLALTNISDVENFPVAAPAKWPKDRPGRAAFLDMLADEDVLELGNEIWAQATLGDEVKKSSAPGDTSPSGASSAESSSTTAADAEKTLD